MGSIKAYRASGHITFDPWILRSTMAGEVHLSRTAVDVQRDPKTSTYTVYTLGVKGDKKNGLTR